MSTQILNCSTIIDIMNYNDNNYNQDERIKRLKTEHFQSLGKTMHIPFGDISNNFRVHNHNNDHYNNTTIFSQFCNFDVKSLLNDKKLYLVLDLDHTLLNSIGFKDLTSEEEYLMTRANQDYSKGTLLRLDTLGILTKLRPFVHQFLHEANKLFEMCIYTMGNRTYALEMAKILDPENKYFKSRIISKDDCPKREYKGFDVLNIPENLVLVVDDTEVAWPNHKDNLILVDKYAYFQSSCQKLGFKNRKSLSVLKRDEDEFDGTLVTILRILRRLHQVFFETKNKNNHPQYAYVRDVRQVLNTTKKDVLKDCKIVFSGIFPKNIVAPNHCLWKMAEELGATCLTELDSCATHVVSVDRGTEKSVWAVQECKYLVHPRWIEAAYYMWRRQPEIKFPVNHAKPTTHTSLKSNNISQHAQSHIL